jgi:hypothetical protein
MVGSYPLLDTISVAMEPWIIEHLASVFETFIQTGSSMVLMQHGFRTHFNVGRHGAVPSPNIILKGVKNLGELDLRPGTAWGGDQTVRTPENIERVPQAVENSPCQSVVHAVPLYECQRGQFAEFYTLTFTITHTKLCWFKNRSRIISYGGLRLLKECWKC